MKESFSIRNFIHDDAQKRINEELYNNSDIDDFEMIIMVMRN